MTDQLGYVQIDPIRLREMEDWQQKNPTESGFRILPKLTAAERVRAKLAEEVKWIDG